MQTHFTLGFSTHRLETLPYAREEMAHHQAIVLEEPPLPVFLLVLQGQAAVDDYLLALEAEFPEFSRQQLAILQDLWQQGYTILQSEPYLERLLEIHELFAQGATPADVQRQERLREVYEREREATAALLRFYEISLRAPFPAVVAAVQEFARRDAARFRLRDELRARELAKLAGRFGTIYVEAGYLHLALPGFLQRLLGKRGRVRSRFLLGPVARQRVGHPYLLGPGDVLTLAYIFRRPLASETATLLAARSLIYIKVLGKEEQPATWSATPHLDEELQLNALIRQLSYADCERLYPMVQRAPAPQAKALLTAYLKERGSDGQSGSR